tara:strand:- start:3895 stop:4182 length:288 start_codon:yes stop_codon:yes gene_type:complete
MTIPYGEDNEMFTYSAFLVLNNRIVVVFVAFGMSLYLLKYSKYKKILSDLIRSSFSVILSYTGESPKNVAPLYKYFMIAFTNTLATFCQYEGMPY